MFRMITMLALLSTCTVFAGEWIWTGEGVPNPKNRFTYFRKAVDLPTIPENALLHVAADSTAKVWINGQVVRRKVTRYHEDRITTDVINAGPYLKPGVNVIVVLHHNWGPIITFQRSANLHAGLNVDSSWVRSDSSWRWMTAPEFLAHERQLVGLNTHARVRYPVVVDSRKSVSGDMHDARFDDKAWRRAVAVKARPWPSSPAPVETEAQREYPVRAEAVVAAGAIDRPKPELSDPFSMAAGIRNGAYRPDEAATARAGAFLAGQPMVIEAGAGEWRYITFDLHRPVHGYPFIDVQSSVPGAVIDLGYTEIARSLYSGKKHVEPNGWINPESVVGEGYADRYVARAGSQRVEMPDERTARWFGIQVYFPEAGRVVLTDAGFIKSQYPVRLVGSFDCGNERIAQFVKLGLIHAEVTMNDVYVDTPGREDGQWIEDSRVRALIADRWFGDWKLRQILLRHYAESQGKDGGFHAFPPSNFPAYPVNFDWSVQWVAMLYDDYYWTGATTLIERYWSNLERYWESVLARVGEDGIFRTNRVFADIRVGARLTDAQQSSGIVTPFIIDRLRWSAEMARAVGRNDQAGRWTAAADKMAAAFRQHHIVPASAGRPALAGDRFDSRNPALPRGFSQAGQSMTILAGLMSRDESRAALDYAFPGPDGTPPTGITRWNNPTFAYRSLRSLSDNGFPQRAVAHLIERYAPYLPGHPRNKTLPALQGPYGGPLPEYWITSEDLGLKDGESNPAQPVDDTGSHGWGAVPLLWLHDSLLGVRIAEPGGTKLHIAPQDGGLPFVSGHTMTPKGPVWVNWEPQHWRLEVRIPKGVTATLSLPEALRGKRVDCVHAGAPPERGGGQEYRLTEEGAYLFTAR
jgi:hypothetical protein